MAEPTTAHRRGRIDEAGDLAAMDLVAFNGGLDPFENRFMEGGFKLGAQYHRAWIEQWGFAGLGAIADMGSGFGRWSVFLAEANDEVTGYERNLAAIDLSRKLADFFELPNLRFEQADVADLSAPDSSYDGVWLNNALQFMDRAKTLTQIRRILKAGAPLFVGVYSALGTVLRTFFEGYARGGISSHAAQFAIRSLARGPQFDGQGAYAAQEHLRSVFRRFGFEIDEAFPVETRPSHTAADAPPFADELTDLAALAKRLDSDPPFAARFALHPEIADAFPNALNFRALKV